MNPAPGVDVTARPVTVIIAAKDEEQRIAASVRAAASIPGVDAVVVVDDGSSDRTGAVARAAGATVVRHERNRGKAAAMQTGAAAVHDGPVGGADDATSAGGGGRATSGAGGAGTGGDQRVLLFLDADLEASAAAAAPLVLPVAAGAADMTIALLPTQAAAGGGHGLVVRLARDGIMRATGWRSTQPLSGQRCLTLEAFEAALPLAGGFGVEVGLTIDLLRQDFEVLEVPCDLHHRVTGKDLRAQLHRGRQFRDVALALVRRGVLPQRFDRVPGAAARRAATWADRLGRRR